jgi:protoheme IX farnesyltransferase
VNRRARVTRSTALGVEEVADRRPDQPSTQQAVVRLTWRERAFAYIALTKPRIIELLLITTVPSMVVAAEGWPPFALVMWTLVGGTLAAGGANAINCYVDRDIDEIMPRTRKRPLPRHQVEPRNALVFGVILGIAAFAVLWATTNLLAAWLAAGALLFYVFVYTIGLKRWTPQNIVIGGAAGAMPALVGWAAVTNTIELPALALFGIIFYWTPPHFWALALRYERDYRSAGVPMMPVVYGREETTKHILLYSFLLLAMCLVFFSLGRMGIVYLSSAIGLNTAFIYLAVKLYRNPTPRIAWTLFKFSIYYLGLLFTAAAADQLLSF